MPRRRLALTLFVIVSLILPLRFARAANEAPQDKPTIPVFTLTGEIAESPTDQSFPLFEPPVASLRDLTQRLTKAARDDNVKAIVLLAEDAIHGAIRQVHDTNEVIVIHQREADE